MVLPLGMVANPCEGKARRQSSSQGRAGKLAWVA